MTTTTQTFPFALSEDEWRARLTPEQYQVLRQHGTERAGTSALDKQNRTGTFFCPGCRPPPLFSDTKFNTATLRPTFHHPLPHPLHTTPQHPHFLTRPL